MLFREMPGFEKIIEESTKESFLRKVHEKYHYLPEDRERLKRVAGSMKKHMDREACWQQYFFRKNGIPFSGAAMTLGTGLDELQEQYEKEGHLTEGYMLETLAGEILLAAYEAYNNWIAENTPYHVARYYFPGSEADYTMELLPELIEKLSVPISCTEGYCMIPKKSVAFYAELTKDREVRCRGICTGCGRRDCPNRAQTGRPLPYGYARILGKEFL